MYLISHPLSHYGKWFGLGFLNISRIGRLQRKFCLMSSTIWGGGGACERAHLLLQLTSWFIIARNSILLLEGICGAWEATLEFDKTFWLLFLWATMCFPFCGTWFWKTVFQMRVANLNTHYHYTQCIHQPKSMLVTKPWLKNINCNFMCNFPPPICLKYVHKMWPWFQQLWLKI